MATLVCPGCKTAVEKSIDPKDSQRDATGRFWHPACAKSHLGNVAIGPYWVRGTCPGCGQDPGSMFITDGAGRKWHTMGMPCADKRLGEASQD